MDLADLRRLVDAFEASDWNEIHLAVDGVEVHLSTAPGVGSGNSGRGDDIDSRPEPAPAAAPAPQAAPADGGPEGVAGTPFATPGSAVGATPTPETAGGDPVLAPSPGIFWRSPAPGRPPFVEVGARVKPDTVVCIVELMKLMNRVSAGCAGVVAAVPVGNGGSVAKGEPILYVTPDPT